MSFTSCDADLPALESLEVDGGGILQDLVELEVKGECKTIGFA